MRISVIIPAAGSSSRFNQHNSEALDVLGAPKSKLDEDLGGKSVLQRTIELFNTRDDVCQIIIAGPYDPDAFIAFKAQHADRLSLLGAKLVQGGRHHRWESVQAALGVVDSESTHVAIHDAARPATSRALIDRVFEAAQRHDAVIPGVRVSDTLKRVDEEPIEDQGGTDQIAAILGDETKTPMFVVNGSIERAHAMGIQTPQIFERALLIRAYAQDDLSSTDDSGLIERLGHRVIVVEGEPTNMKLTHANELPLLRAIMGVKRTDARPSHKRF